MSEVKKKTVDIYETTTIYFYSLDKRKDAINFHIALATKLR